MRVILHQSDKSKEMPCTGAALGCTSEVVAACLFSPSPNRESSTLGRLLAGSACCAPSCDINSSAKSLSVSCFNAYKELGQACHPAEMWVGLAGRMLIYVNIEIMVASEQ